MGDLEQIHGEHGQLFISERALEMIVYGALLEVDGLYAPDRVKGEGILDSLSKVTQGGGIQIQNVPVPSDAPPGHEHEVDLVNAEKILKIKLALVAEFGIPIHEAAEKVITIVRAKVKELAGLEVEDVELEITGIVKT